MKYNKKEEIACNILKSYVKLKSGKEINNSKP